MNLAAITARMKFSRAASAETCCLSAARQISRAIWCCRSFSAFQLFSRYSNASPVLWMITGVRLPSCTMTGSDHISVWFFLSITMLRRRVGNRRMLWHAQITSVEVLRSFALGRIDPRQNAESKSTSDWTGLHFAVPGLRACDRVKRRIDLRPLETTRKRFRGQRRL